jgi:hypothetical protein
MSVGFSSPIKKEMGEERVTDYYTIIILLSILDINIY